VHVAEDGVIELRAGFADPRENDVTGANPARSATSISPAELASARLPSAFSRRAMARVELAFNA
jgi:hypothetical protein